MCFKVPAFHFICTKVIFISFYIFILVLYSLFYVFPVKLTAMFTLPTQNHLFPRHHGAVQAVMRQVGVAVYAGVAQ